RREASGAAGVRGEFDKIGVREPLADHVRSTVGGGVVHDDDGVRPPGLAGERVQRLGQKTAPVVGDHDGADVRTWGTGGHRRGLRLDRTTPFPFAPLLFAALPGAMPAPLPAASSPPFPAESAGATAGPGGTGSMPFSRSTRCQYPTRIFQTAWFRSLRCRAMSLGKAVRRC